MRDPILAGLASATAANSQIEFPVVLITGGLVVEGTLVAGARWLDEIAALLEAGGQRAASVGGVFRSAAAAVTIDAAVGGARDGEILHLLAATVRSAGRVEAVGHWRVALDAVDGWKLGTAGVPRAVATG